MMMMMIMMIMIEIKMYSQRRVQMGRASYLPSSAVTTASFSRKPAVSPPLPRNTPTTAAEGAICQVYLESLIVVGTPDDDDDSDGDDDW